MATPVEVKDLETFGYYTAFAKDVKDGEVLVSYENNWRPEAWVPLQYVRRAPPPFNPATFHVKVGDAVEAMAKSADTDPFSWWKANVKSVKGDFIYISYAEWGNEYDEVLEKEMIRPLNKNPPLTAAELKKSSIPIPPEVWNSESKSLVQDFSTYTIAGAFSVSIDPEGKQLTVIGSQRSCDRVLMIAKLNFKHLAEIERLRKKTRLHEEKMKKLEERKQKGANESFTVHQDLMGLVIGKSGKNVKEAEAIPGVTNIRVDSKTMTVHIFAKTAEAALEARRRLEFVEVEFPVKRGQIARLVGRNFSNIRDIEQDSKVIRIRAPPDPRAMRDEETGDDWFDDTVEVDPEEEVPFVITGTVEAVDTAKFAMEYALANIAKITAAADVERQTSARRAEMEEELGYLTDEDQPAGGPQGVWRGRGRGRGRGGGRGYQGRYEDEEEDAEDQNWREGDAGDGKKRSRRRRHRGRRDEYATEFAPAETKGQQQQQGGGGQGGGRGGGGRGRGGPGQGGNRGGGQQAGRGGGGSGKPRDGAPVESYKKVQPNQQNQQNQQKKPQQQSTPQNPPKQGSNDSKPQQQQQQQAKTQQPPVNNNKGGTSGPKPGGGGGKVEDKTQPKKDPPAKKEDNKDSKKPVSPPNPKDKEKAKELPKETKEKPKEQAKGGQEKSTEKPKEKEEEVEEEEDQEEADEQGGDEEQDEEE